MIEYVQIIYEVKSVKDSSTEKLEISLKNTKISELDKFFTENENELIYDDKPFKSYMKMMIKNKNKNRRDIFLQADIPERYGYKILLEEKHTKQRDVILRICYASGFSLDETQRAIKLYNMPELFVKYPRDLILMKCFDERPGNLFDVNDLLVNRGYDPLWDCGSQE